MATINFSIPADVRDAFNKEFSGRNKSAIIADLMRGAVEEKQREHESRLAVKRILKRRRTKAEVSRRKILAAREELRQ